MKLEKFKRKNNKKKIIIVGSVVLVLLITVVIMYRSFAFFENIQEFNVIKGSVPDQNYDIMLSLTTEDENQNKKTIEQIPEKNSEQKYEVEVSCNNNAIGSWNYDDWKPEINEFSTSRTKCTINFKENNDFVYPVTEKIEDGKKLIANAITQKGVSTSAEATFETMANNIKKITATLKRASIGTGSSDAARTFSATSIPNYKSLNVTNFVVSAGSAVHASTSNFSENRGNLTSGISYNASTGILTVPSSLTKAYYNANGQSFDKGYFNYTVYCYYIG